MAFHFRIPKDCMMQHAVWKLLLVGVCLKSYGVNGYWKSFLSEGDGNVSEYCQQADFSADCGTGKVIVMTSSRYGRMKLGKCMRRDYGSLGCAADVMKEMDRRCSGRRSCRFPLAQLHHNTLPCPPDLMSYLEAGYYCQTVSDRQPWACGSPIPLVEPSGFIANSVTVETGRGSVTCPWKITAQAGQQINITLVNFARVPLPDPAKETDAAEGGGGGGGGGGGAAGLAVGSTPPRMRNPGTRVCYQFAEIREGEYNRRLTECEGGARLAHAYLSEAPEVQVNVLTRAAEGNKDIYFMLHYQVLGCASPTVTPGLWVSHRNKNDAIIKCNSTGATWHVTCADRKWQGRVGNCTVPSVASQENWDMRNLFENETFPYSILIVVAIGVALGVFLGGILLVCASRYFKRRRSDRRAEEISHDMYIPNRGKMMSSNYDETAAPARHPYIDSVHYQETREGHRAPPGELDCKCPYSPYKTLPPPHGFKIVTKGSSHIYESPQFERKDS